MIQIDMAMPETCDMCRFGCWSNLYQTAGCTLTDGEQMFEVNSKEYRQRRSDKCPLIDADYQLAEMQREHDILYEPTYDPEDGSM